MSLFKKIFRKKRRGIDELVGIRILSEADEILRSLGLRPWLTDGTLLGYFREGKFIGHDTDLDIGCLITQYSREIIPEFTKKDWFCASIFGTLDCGLELSFVKEGIKLDIFFFYAEEDRLWHGCWNPVRRTHRKLIKYYYQSFELVDTEFLGFRFSIPEETEKYIKAKYGEGWETPLADWDWASDPENLVATDVVIPNRRGPFTTQSLD